MKDEITMVATDATSSHKLCDRGLTRTQTLTKMAKHEKIMPSVVAMARRPLWSVGDRATSGEVVPGGRLFGGWAARGMVEGTRGLTEGSGDGRL